MSVLNAFLSTWTNARATFGEGAPQTGERFDQSATLNQLRSNLDEAAPGRRWSGGAATQYVGVNAEHQRVIGELGKLDLRLAVQIDQSAQIVAGGRRDLDAVRRWVLDAAASVPQSQAGELMLLPIVRKGLSQVNGIVTRAHGDLNSVGGTIHTIGSEYQALSRGQRFGVSGEGDDGDEVQALGNGTPTDEADRKKNQSDAFREVFGRNPVSNSDWLTAAALDPHSYHPNNEGVEANIVVGRIKPVPGQGVVRTNLFIPSEDVWAPTPSWPPYDSNLGDNRGFSPTAGPEDSRVAIYTDFENGIVVARQNPSINADTGEVRTGTPDISAVQQSNGSVLIDYNAADPFSPGGEGLAKSSGISVNGTLGIAPSEAGPRVGGDVTTFPALEIYNDRGGTTTPLLQSWPSFRDDAAGPLAGLPFDKGVGDPTVVSSFNSVVPQISPPDPAPRSGPAPIPITPPMSIVPPQNFTAFGPASGAPSVRVYTPLSGDEFLPR